MFLDFIAPNDSSQSRLALSAMKARSNGSPVCFYWLHDNAVRKLSLMSPCLLSSLKTSATLTADKITPSPQAGDL
jgi:hypothetical protein